jgi:hypothetical protein
LQAPAPIFKTLVDDRLRKKTGNLTVESTTMEDSRQTKERTFSRQKKTVKPTWLKPSDSTPEDDQVMTFK